ncbi:ATP-grasp domain-containing protein [Sphingobium boeckii]|uniref:Glutathione synthase/RimK-type ligase-like ATP-grasp enzyme n=1 Tax=Sphingobium boeckii TaxID=1082345 RepID=A0A7W9EF92_9SPHN|nr:hypothetical protein [Sphingobium boeckii]MBB5685820.1 glutathione synthase/RimK-type ligase-like ATP-grasp enzyme [Sphingobium boeckii]
MPKIAILVPDPDHTAYAPMLPIQRGILTAALALDGIVPDFVPWTSGADLARYDLVLPLLVWGYHDAPALWRAKLDDWEAANIRMANPPAMLRWNGEKTYLLDFADRGAPVVPSVFAEAATPALLDEARAVFGDIALIAKPTISAGAHGVIPVQPGNPLPESALGGPTLIQPMLPAISSEGEYSLFYFGGAFSHAVLKVPQSGDFRVQIQYGGRNVATEAPPAALAAAQSVLALIGAPPLYARVDLVADGAGGYLLMELELIEPQLFFELAPDRGLAFARAVRRAAAPNAAR